MWNTPMAPPQLNIISLDELKLYKDCVSLQSRLFSLPGFALYSDLLDLADPIDCIHRLFILGIPLCHLWNLLPSRKFPKIELDFTLGQEYTRRFAIAQFASSVHLVFRSDHFNIDDLLTSETNAGFDKAVRALSVVLDELRSNEYKGPSHANLKEPTSIDDEAYSIVAHLLQSERNHVAEMELLEKFCSILADIGTLDAKTLSLVFPKKLFIFARKFRIRLECVAQMPWKEQNWGAPFIAHAMDIAMNLRIHCVNWILVKPALAGLDMESLQIPDFTATPVSVEALVSKPLHHLFEYQLILGDLMRISAATNHKHHEELNLGIASIQQVMDRIMNAQREAVSNQTIQTLQTRIANWRDLDANKLGQLIIEGSLLTRRNNILQNFDVFLFEKFLLLCSETLPPPASSRLGRRKVSSASIPPSRGNMLYIEHYFTTRDISIISQSQFYRAQNDSIRKYFELVLAIGTDVISLLYLTEHDMQEWHDKPFHTRRKLSMGTLTNLENGPLPKSIASLTSAEYSAFVKLYFGGNIFVLSIPLPVRFEELMERIDKKLRHFPGWSREMRNVSHTDADGHTIIIGPETPLEPIFQEGVMVSLDIR
ncbi:hypothetical protein BDP27DRAFT_1311016 [Rhodocollybia butyracea]|uniref:DH domain-containing protein n=1 Tax=Rhodocollybia butyracea TaxID=206335 RepID=A0A9P5QCJ3_9AGAR|nr:hypothetical protein BDP27DRAFT_1311016 [Rhodocollybia butyracea]